LVDSYASPTPVSRLYRDATGHTDRVPSLDALRRVVELASGHGQARGGHKAGVEP
jgi:hypothetical protein